MMYFHIHMGSPLSNFDKHLYKPRRPISKVLSPSESRLKVCLQCASPVHGPEVVVCHSHHHELASVRCESGSPFETASEARTDASDVSKRPN